MKSMLSIGKTGSNKNVGGSELGLHQTLVRLDITKSTFTNGIKLTQIKEC